jgi:hypothetical protein
MTSSCLRTKLAPNGALESWRYAQKNRPICLLRSFKGKRLRIKQIGRFFSVYLVQSVHAQHLKEVNAARASGLARYAVLSVACGRVFSWAWDLRSRIPGRR